MKLKSAASKTRSKKIDSSRRCITCNKTCSMSGLCMKPWPEFTVGRKERASHGDEDDPKNRQN